MWEGQGESDRAYIEVKVCTCVCDQHIGCKLVKICKTGKSKRQNFKFGGKALMDEIWF